MSGSKVVCTYPNLIAAYHVLRRLLEPRHPPFALSFFFFAYIIARYESRIYIAPVNLAMCYALPTATLRVTSGAPVARSGVMCEIATQFIYYIVNLIAY